MPGNLPWPVGGRERRPVPRPDYQVYGDDDEDDDDEGGGYGGGARGRGGGFGGAGHQGAEEMELPEGVDASEVEEARMLEAALLGVPYQGRIPDFSNRRVAALPSSRSPALGPFPCSIPHPNSPTCCTCTNTLCLYPCAGLPGRRVPWIPP